MKRAAVFAALLVVYCLYDAIGLVDHAFVWTTPLVILSFLAMGALAYFKPVIHERWIEPHPKWAKPVMCIALVAVSLFVMERAYVTHLVMGIPYILLNLCILGVLFCIVFFAGQRTRGAALTILIVCFIYGLANYFVISFKGQPVMPADLFALGTASAVSSGYVYSITDSVAVSYTAFSFGLLLVMLLPKTKITGRKVVINTSIALSCMLVFGAWFSATAIEEDYQSYFYMFRPQLSYADYGSLLCFLSLAQQLNPELPQNYSSDTVEEIASTYTTFVDEPKASQENPSIVVVMNETFSDLSTFDAIAETYSGLEYYDSIDDAIIKGEAYVSVLGGGTCNSEFELLTGSTMANLGSGYPYMSYDLSQASNMAGILKEFGYETTAIHPDKATNWKRDVIYGDFGFDEFIDETAFEGAQTMRTHTRDIETYKTVIEVLESSDEPQFVFDVTMQNHGGYDKGGIPRAQKVEAPIDGIDHPELNEYLSTMKQSDADLQYLIEELSAIDEPVVLCFFGDHQPSIMSWLSEYMGYEDLKEAGIEELQDFYVVPYMIWANYDIDEETIIELLEMQQGFDMAEAQADALDELVDENLDEDGDANEGLSNDDSSNALDNESSSEYEGLGSLTPTSQNSQDKDGEVDWTSLGENTAAIATAFEIAPSETAAETVPEIESEEVVVLPLSSNIELDMSLNYMGAFVLKIAGLPLDSYQSFLIDSYQEMPVINANGFRDAACRWHTHDDEETLVDLRWRYSVLQYNALFGSEK